MGANFDAYRTVILETFRKTGEAVPTPIWFVQQGNTLYMRSYPDAGKFKRIRNNPRVRVAAADPREDPILPFVAGTARIIEDEAEAKRMYDLLDKRYGGYFSRTDRNNPMVVFAVELDETP